MRILCKLTILSNIATDGFTEAGYRPLLHNIASEGWQTNHFWVAKQLEKFLEVCVSLARVSYDVQTIRPENENRPDRRWTCGIQGRTRRDRVAPHPHRSSGTSFPWFVATSPHPIQRPMTWPLLHILFSLFLSFPHYELQCRAIRLFVFKQTSAITHHFLGKLCVPKSVLAGQDVHGLPRRVHLLAPAGR